MKNSSRGNPPLMIKPLTPARWPDLCALFGSNGACGGCWCMTPRLSSAEYTKNKGAGNKRKLKALVDSGKPPGLLGYLGGEVVSWCSIEPREKFPKLARSRVLAPVDDQPVWSIVCLFVRKDMRNKGISAAMISGAADWANRQGARIIEGYPTEPRKGRMPDVFAWTGIASAYLKAGFKEAARRSPTRLIMRRGV